MAYLVDKVISALDNNAFICSIFKDLSKAFDTTNYNILLEKLNKYGFNDIAYKWLKMYVANRRKFVCVKGCYSNKARLIHSILDPLLFLIYIKGGIL